MTKMGSSSRRLVKSGRASAYSSDYRDDEPAAPQRSISLSALHTNGVPLEPRMAQLETLEAKMASIEVSLSTTPRRKKSNSAATTPTPTPITINTPTEHNVVRPVKDVAQELDMLRTTLRDKENLIHSLKGQLCSSLSMSRLSYLQRSAQPLSERERRVAEDRLTRLRSELDTKTLAIKNIKLSLEHLHITDNIDVRIQQAELEYQLGREELNLLSILEEIRNLQAALEDTAPNKQANTIFHYVKDSCTVSLHALETVYDPKSPRFGITILNDSPDLYIEWAAEDSGLVKGDRLLEANGKIVLAKSREDLQKLLAVSPDPAQLVVMRQQPPPQLEAVMTSLRAELSVVREKAGEAERTRDSIRSDNLRLTHRISYLEEQVSDLLDRAREETRPQSSAASSTSSVKSVLIPPSPSKPELQVFQKGPQVTALVGTLPVLDVRGKKITESKQKCPTVKASIPTPDQPAVLEKRSSSSDTEKIRRKKKDSHLHTARSTHSLDLATSPFTKCQKYLHHIDNSKRVVDYSSETSIREGRFYKRRSESQQSELERRQRHLRDARSSLFDLAERDKVSEISGRDLNHTRPSSCQLSMKHDPLGRKSLDCSSETLSSFYKHSDPRLSRPVPPKKPLRLSLQRATSLQSVEANDKKPLKRNYRGENPLTGLQSSLYSSNHSKPNHSEKWC